MIKAVLLVGSGGFFGSVVRYLIQQYFVQITTGKFPWGTFVANMIGSFIIGAIYALTERMGYFSQEIRLLFAVGFCGGFTTFSSFANENLNFLKTGDFAQFFIYTGASIALGLLMVAVGYVMIKMLQ